MSRVEIRNFEDIEPRVLDEIALIAPEGDEEECAFNAKVMAEMNIDSDELLAALMKALTPIAVMLNKGYGFAVMIEQEGRADLFGVKQSVAHCLDCGKTLPLSGGWCGCISGDGSGEVLPDLVERLESGVTECGDDDHGNCLYLVDDASDVMLEAASTIRTQATALTALQAENERLAKECADAWDKCEERRLQAEKAAARVSGTIKALELSNAVQTGYATWAAKPHNSKWVKRIDGTPIPNDLIVCIQGAVLAAIQPDPEPQPVAMKHEDGCNLLGGKGGRLVISGLGCTCTPSSAGIERINEDEEAN